MTLHWGLDSHLSLSLTKRFVFDGFSGRLVGWAEINSLVSTWKKDNFWKKLQLWSKTYDQGLLLNGCLFAVKGRGPFRITVLGGHGNTGLFSSTKRNSHPHTPFYPILQPREQRHTISYLFTLWLCILFSKLEWWKVFLKLLESLHLVQMSVLSDTFSPEDTLACSILTGWRRSHLACIYLALGEKLQSDWDESYY